MCGWWEAGGGGWGGGGRGDGGGWVEVGGGRVGGGGERGRPWFAQKIQVGRMVFKIISFTRCILISI